MGQLFTLWIPFTWLFCDVNLLAIDYFDEVNYINSLTCYYNFNPLFSQRIFSPIFFHSSVIFPQL